MSTGEFHITFRKPTTNNEIWFDNDGDTSMCLWFSDNAMGVWNGKTNSGFTLTP